MNDRQNGNKGILLVDDEEIICQLFQMVLEDEFPGERIDIASNGREAIESFVKRHYDVVVMDLHMPVMDGVEAFQKLNTLCECGGIVMPHVVFCTGFMPPAHLMDEINATDYHAFLMKPVANELLVSTVSGYLP